MIGVIIADLVKTGNGSINNTSHYTGITVRTIAVMDWFNLQLEKSYKECIESWSRKIKLPLNKKDVSISFAPISLYHMEADAHNIGESLSKSLHLKSKDWEFILASIASLKQEDKKKERIEELINKYKSSKHKSILNAVSVGKSFSGALNAGSDLVGDSIYYVGALADVFYTVPLELKNKAYKHLHKDMVKVIKEFEKQVKYRNTEEWLEQQRFVQI